MIVAAAGAGAGFPWWAFDLPFWSVVVFALMIGVLAAFARKPLATNMRKRQFRIVNELRQAENVRREIEQLRERHNRERIEFERQVQMMLAEGRRDAESFSARLVARAREEAGRITARTNREINLLKQRVMHDLWQATADWSSLAAERVLESELGADDHRRLIDSAVGEIVEFSGGKA